MRTACGRVAVWCLAAVALHAFPNALAGEEAPKTKTVGQAYPLLLEGALANARLVELPPGVLLRSGDMEIRLNEVEQFIEEKPDYLHDELTNNRVFILEQLGTVKLLTQLARTELTKAGQSPVGMTDGQLIGKYIDSITKDVKVTDEEVRKFYDANASLLCGAAFNDVKKPIHYRLLEEKKQETARNTVLSLGDKVTVELSESWIRENAPSALDNPVNRARQSGKPTLAVFSGASCCGPDKARPIVDSVQKKYGDKLNVVYIEARENQVLAARHGIEAIPTFILYDGKGKETPRHDGLLTLDEIAAMLRQVGIE